MATAKELFQRELDQIDARHNTAARNSSSGVAVPATGNSSAHDLYIRELDQIDRRLQQRAQTSQTVQTSRPAQTSRRDQSKDEREQSARTRLDEALDPNRTANQPKQMKSGVKPYRSSGTVGNRKEGKKLGAEAAETASARRAATKKITPYQYDPEQMSGTSGKFRPEEYYTEEYGEQIRGRMEEIQQKIGDWNQGVYIPQGTVDALLREHDALNTEYAAWQGEMYRADQESALSALTAEEVKALDEYLLLRNEPLTSTLRRSVAERRERKRREDQLGRELLQKYGNELWNLVEYRGRQINEAISEQNLTRLTDAATQDWAGAAGAGALSVLQTYMAGPMAAAETLGQRVSQMLGFTNRHAPIDTNAPGFELQNEKMAIRETQRKQITGENPTKGQELLAFAYDGIMSSLDSVAAATTPGGIGAVLLSTEAGADAVKKYTESGATAHQAVVMGVAAAVNEWLFERISIGEFKNMQEVPLEGWRSFLHNLLISGGIVNAAEETVTEAANVLFDMWQPGNISEWEKRVRELTAYFMEENGLSREEAERLAKKTAAGEFGKQIGLAGAAGLFQGLLMGGVGSLGSVVRNGVGRYTPETLRQNQARWNEEARLQNASIRAGLADAARQNTEAAGQTPVQPGEMEITAGADLFREEQAAAEQAAEARAEEIAEDVRAGAETPAEAETLIRERAEALRREDPLTADALDKLTTAQDNENGTGVIPATEMQEGEYGTEAAGERTDVSDGSGQWDAGRSAGEQTRGVDGTPGGNPAQSRGGSQAAQAVGRQNHARTLRLQKISPAQAGIRNGSGDSTMTVMPQNAWDNEMTSNAARIKAETGLDVVYYLGQAKVSRGRRSFTINGVIQGNRIYIKADHLRYSVTQLTDHELYHNRVRQDPGLVRALRDRIASDHREEDFRRIAEDYASALDGVYRSDDDLNTIYEEIFADAYAGMNQFGQETGKEQAYIRGMTAEREQNRTLGTAADAADLEAGTTEDAEAENQLVGEDEEPPDEWAFEERDDEERFSIEEEEENRYSVTSLLEAAGLVVTMEDNVVRAMDLEGNPVTEVNEAMVWKSGIGALINRAATAAHTISEEDAQKQIEGATELLNMLLKAQDGGLVWECVGASMFSAVKSNSDGQYGTTIDFTTICRKTQNMVDEMSQAMVELKRGLTREEVTEIQKRTIEEGGTVQCPVCYVFSRWAGIGGILGNMSKFQRKYGHAYDGFVDDNGVYHVSQALQDRIDQLKAATKSAASLRAMLHEYDGEYAAYEQERDEATEQKKTLNALKRNLMRTKPDGYLQAIEDIDEAIELQNTILERVKKDLKKLESEGTPELSWLINVRSAQDYWEDGNVDEDILFDLNRGQEFAELYPVAWKYRTGRGPSAGKAILPYSDMRLGDLFMGPENNSANGNDLFKFVKDGEFDTDQIDAIEAAEIRMKAQNLIGGQRFQSTSDFRYEYGLDYLMAFWELQAIGGKMQTYTKVPEFAEIVANIGGDVNLSVMGRDKGYEDGHLVYSYVTGMNIDAAKLLNARYHNVQLILVGINDEHIRLALSDSKETGGDIIGFVIPYHASGASITDFISKLVENLGEHYDISVYRNYEPLQRDSNQKIPGASEEVVGEWMKALRENPDNPAYIGRRPTAAQQRMLDQRLLGETRKVLLKHRLGNSTKAAETFIEKMLPRIRGVSRDISGRSFEDLRYVEQRALQGDPAAIREYESWSRGILWSIYNKMWVDENAEDTYGVRLNTAQAETIMPHEYWNTSVNRDRAYVNGFIFRSYCYSMGMVPRFTGMNSKGKNIGYGDFSTEAGYWKLLIDRAMYDNDGVYRAQQKINATNLSGEMLQPAYAEEHWGEYRVEGGDKEIAERVAQGFIEDVRRREAEQRLRLPEDDFRYSVADEQDEENLFTMQAVETLRSIGQKSVSQFTSEDIKKAEPWARKFYRELGTKSPFFRAWFGDWRAADTTKIALPSIDLNVESNSGNAINIDTGKKLSWNRDFKRESLLYTNKNTYNEIRAFGSNAAEIVKNAVLLDTNVSSKDSKRKMPGTSFMHSFYTLAPYDGRLVLIKMYAEEALSEKTGEDFTRAYMLKAMEKVADIDNSVLSNGGLTGSRSTTSSYTVADLYALVKQYDRDFHGKEPSKTINADGTPKVVYHRTNADFDTFDTSLSGSNQGKTHGDGIYLSTSRDAFNYAGDKVMKLYSSIRNPFEMEMTEEEANRVYDKYAAPHHNDRFGLYRPHAIDALMSSYKVFDYLDEYAQESGVKVSEILKYIGYDGVHDGPEWVAFDPEQVKSATDNIGTFDMGNQNTRYSVAGEHAGNADTALLETARELESMDESAGDIYRQTGWFRGMDGRWRWEIDDSNMRFFPHGDARLRRDDPEYVRYLDLFRRVIEDGNATEAEMAELRELDRTYGGETRRLAFRLNMGNATLGDVLDHPALFEAYPELEDMPFRFADLGPRTGGEFNPTTRTITLNPSVLTDTEGTLIHEIQHAIQQAEDFARGASPEYWMGKQIGNQVKLTALQVEAEDLWKEIKDLEESSGYNAYAEQMKATADRGEITDDEAYDRIQEWERENLPQLGEMYDRYWDMVYEQDDLQARIDRTPMDLYRNTYGEQEARDAADRRTLTREQRMDTMPYAGDENTVFAEPGNAAGSSYDTSDTGPQEGEYIPQRAPGMEKLMRGAIAGLEKGFEIHRRAYQPQARRVMMEFLDRCLETGSIDAGDLAEVTRQLWNMGGQWSVEEEGGFDEVRRFLRRGVSLYVPAEVQHEFADDWKNARIQLVGLGIRPTSRTYEMGVDQYWQTLTERFPGFFDEDETDRAEMLRQIIDTAKKGRRVWMDNDQIDRETAEQMGADTDERFNYLQESIYDLASDFLDVAKPIHDKWAAKPHRPRRRTAQSAEVLEPAGAELFEEETEETPAAASPERNIDDYFLGSGYMEDRAADVDVPQLEPAGAELVDGDEPPYVNQWDDRGERWTGDMDYYGGEDFDPTMTRADFHRLNGELVPEVPGERTEAQILHEDSTRAAEAALQEYLTREGFQATDHINDLGVKIDGSVPVNYGMAQGLLFSDRANKAMLQDIRKAERRLGVTAAEKEFAHGIVAGLYLETDIPRAMRADKVMELAQYYMDERALGEDMIRQQRTEINRKLDERMRDLFRDIDEAVKKVPSLLRINYNTPQRNMRAIFGDELGERINREIFDPVARNEAERLRWINQQFDKVRTFRDSRGRKRSLTQQESALVQMVIEGRAVAEQVASMEMEGAIRAAAEDIRRGGDPAESAREQNLTTDERKIAEKFARWMEAQELLQSDKVDSVKVKNAVAAYQALFNAYYDAINDFLVVHGYEPIGFIKGYAPHMQSEESVNALSKALQAFGIKSDVTELDTGIAGRTKDFRPAKRWNPYFLSRMGDETNYDIQQAFESYIDYLSDILYHTDDIMRLRRMSRYFRQTYSREEIRNNIEWAMGLQDAGTEQKAEYLRDQGVIGSGSVLSDNDISKAMDEYVDGLFDQITKTTKFGNMVMWLDNYTNLLAGKQNAFDRAMEEFLGRRALNMGSRLTRWFARSNVGGNLSSVLNQTSQIPMILAENGNRNVMQAVFDILSGKVAKAGFAQESDFLTGKRDIKYLENTTGETITDWLFKPANFMDGMVSTIAVRAAYRRGLHQGMTHEEALRFADRYGAEVMGTRMKGQKPVSFDNRNPLMQAVNMFQIEALNAWDHIGQDLPRDIRRIAAVHGRRKAAAALAGIILKALLAAFVINRISEEVYGGTPAPFDLMGLTAGFIASGEGLSTNAWIRRMIDNGTERAFGERLFDTDRRDPEREFDLSGAAEDLGYNVSNEVPFFRNVSGLLGWGDETLPIPDIYGGVKDIADAAKNAGFLSGETAEAAGLLAAQFLPGGRQATKTIQGLRTMANGARIKGYGENARLQYPVEDSTWNWIRAIMFGNSALHETQDYYASGSRGLNKDQTSNYNSMLANGATRQDALDLILGKQGETPSQQYKTIIDSNVSEAEKLRQIQKVMGGRWPASYAKVEGLVDLGIGLEDWYDVYTVKNTDGKKKADVMDVIDGLPLTERQKDALYTYCGYAESKIGDAPWH